MDNDCSGVWKEAMKNYQIEFQLAPPHIHRKKGAERSIITCKNHFISVFSTTDTFLSIRELDHLLSQFLITFILPRTSWVNPALSAYAYLIVPYDFNKSPMVPPGTRVIVSDKHGNHISWRYPGTQGWYISPSLDHYRYMQCYTPTTGIVRITYILQ